MSDSQYADKDLVALYDVLNSGTDDHEFYVEIPNANHSRILDVGCGTGVLAVAFANTGHDVIGVDPAMSMIEYAMNRKGASAVEWHCSSINDFTDVRQFDLITMTGHAFQCLHDDQEILQFFQSIEKLLRKNGRFVFETRNPAFNAWLKWTPVESLVKSMTAIGEPFEVYHQVDSVSDQFVEFSTFYNYADGRESKTCHSKLRFINIEKLSLLIDEASLTICEVFGDWDKSPLSDLSPEIICSVQKSG